MHFQLNQIINKFMKLSIINSQFGKIEYYHIKQNHYYQEMSLVELLIVMINIERNIYIQDGEHLKIKDQINQNH